jgi:DNA-binding GntR family transcriptional regulator
MDTARRASDETVSFPQQAYEYVRDRIVNLRFKPGEYITDTQIANELKISRTPVREAFTRLQNEGLLVNEARRGWRVYTLTIADIHELFDIKEVVEGMIARKAAACADERLRDAFQAALERMSQAAETGDSAAWLQADIALHNILFDMASNERARRLVMNLNDQWHRVRIGFVAMQGRTRRSTQEHFDFAEAILAGDGEEAEKRMRRHLNNVREELVRLLINVVLPFVQEGV